MRDGKMISLPASTRGLSEYAKGMIITIVGAVCWGISGTCSQYLCSVQGMDSRWVTQIRLICAGIILVIYSLIRERERFGQLIHTPKALAHCVIFGVCGLMFTQYTYTTSISATNSGTATVLQYMSVIIVLAVSCVMSRKLPVLREILAILSCLAGRFLVATHGSLTGLSISRAGLFWGILSAVAAACYIMIPQKLMKEWGSTLPVGQGMLYGGIAFFFLMRMWTRPLQVDLRSLLALAVIVVVGTVLAFVFFLWGTSIIGPARGNMVGCMEPLVATLTTVLFLHTSFLPVDFIGFGFIIATVFILARR